MSRSANSALFSPRSAWLSLTMLSCLTSAHPRHLSKDSGIKWGDCSGAPTDLQNLINIAKLKTPNIECGRLSVPLDHSGDAKGDISLGFVRLNTTSPKRLGTLFYNPGGPGMSGAAAVLVKAMGLADVLSDTALEHYDVIGYDPRGSGMSSPVKCDEGLLREEFSTTPESYVEFEKLVAVTKALGESCSRLTGPLLNHMDTRHIARDLELLRAALGDDKLNFIGVSYGTMIAQQYLEFYPEHVGRFVLDGNVDHSLSQDAAELADATGIEATLNIWFKWCEESPKCALHGKDVAHIFKEVVASAEKTPLPVLKCPLTLTCKQPVRAQDILQSLPAWLGDEEPTPGVDWNWPGLGRALKDASERDGTLFAIESPDNSVMSGTAGLATYCQDWNHNLTTHDDISLRLAGLTAVAPYSRGIAQSYSAQLMCMGWPAPITNPNRALDPLQVAKAPPVMMLQSLYDPATSYSGAMGLKAQIPQARLVVRNGVGHGSYHLGGDVTRMVDDFLVNGILPEDGMIVPS